MTRKTSKPSQAVLAIFGHVQQNSAEVAVICPKSGFFPENRQLHLDPATMIPNSIDGT